MAFPNIPGVALLDNIRKTNGCPCYYGIDSSVILAPLFQTALHMCAHTQVRVMLLEKQLEVCWLAVSCAR